MANKRFCEDEMYWIYWHLCKGMKYNNNATGYIYTSIGKVVSDLEPTQEHTDFVLRYLVKR